MAFLNFGVIDWGIFMLKLMLLGEKMGATERKKNLFVVLPFCGLIFIIP